MLAFMESDSIRKCIDRPSLISISPRCGVPGRGQRANRHDREPFAGTQLTYTLSINDSDAYAETPKFPTITLGSLMMLST